MSNPTTPNGLKTGWIGLGKMGLPITDNLLKAGFDLFDIDQGRAQAQASKGAYVASNVGDLARAADVVFSIIPDDAALEAIALADGGVLAAARAGTVYTSI